MFHAACLVYVSSKILEFANAICGVSPTLFRLLLIKALHFCAHEFVELRIAKEYAVFIKFCAHASVGEFVVESYACFFLNGNRHGENNVFCAIFRYHSPEKYVWHLVSYKIDLRVLFLRGKN